MDEILTAAQIESKFVAEWVLVKIRRPMTPGSASGVVRYHSKNRTKSIAKRRTATEAIRLLYTGPFRRRGGRVMSVPFDAQRGSSCAGRIDRPSGMVVVRLALDTGATRTLINASLLVAIGYDPLRPLTVRK